MTFFLVRALPTELVLCWPFNIHLTVYLTIIMYHRTTPKPFHPRSWAKKIATMDFHQMLGTWRKVKRRKAQSLALLVRTPTQKKTPQKPPMKKMMGTFNSLEIWGYNSWKTRGCGCSWWRLLGFLNHFTGYYDVLWPLGWWKSTTSFQGLFKKSS